VSALVPYRFLFRYSFAVRFEGKLPRRGKNLLGLTGKHRLPDLGELDAAQSFGVLRVAWNEQGLGISAQVHGKRSPLACDLTAPESSDGLQVWIDTRNTQSIHRASRFCHHFCLLPRGGGKGENEPAGAQLAIPRAREPTPLADPGDIRVAASIAKDGYLLEAWLPAKALNGYDPEAQNRLGFCYLLRDAELGEQTSSAGAEFPFAFDPSLWGTLELVK
jgi:hypothetical protein